MLMASAQTARSEAEEDTRQRRAELHDQRVGVERREQRLAEREERLDAEIHALEDKVKHLDDRARPSSRPNVKLWPTSRPSIR